MVLMINYVCMNDMITFEIEDAYDIYSTGFTIFVLFYNNSPLKSMFNIRWGYILSNWHL